MTKMTFDEYDRIAAIFERVRASGEVPVLWPTVRQIDMFYTEPNRWLRLVCYLHDTNPAPQTPAERYSKQNMMIFISDNLELVANE